MLFRLLLVAACCAAMAPKVLAQGGSSRFIAEVPTGWKKPVRAVAVSVKGRLLAAGGDARQLILYDLVARRTRWISSARGPVTALAFSPDGKSLAIGWQGRWVDLVAVKSGRVLRRVGPLLGWPRSLAFSPGGKVLAVAGQAQQIALFDPATGKARGLLTGHTSWVNHVAFSDNGKRIAGAGWDHAVRIWDGASRKLLRSVRAHRYAVNAVVFSRGGKWLISASDDQRLRRIQVSTGKVVTNRRSPAVLCLARARRADLVVGGTYRGRLLFFREKLAKAVKVIYAHRGQVFAVAVTPNGRVVITGGRDGKIKLWKGR
jgi:WD40 repeat protein